MVRTSGIIVPSPHSSDAEIKRDLDRRAKAAGYTPFDPLMFVDEPIEHFSTASRQRDIPMIIGEEAKPSLEDLALQHFGVKGMHWGVRNSNPTGVSRGTNREAKKDAEEFARAKLFYGEGAGNRRKLIKATVEGKSKKDPAYAKAFQSHLDRQDLSRHAEKARGERHRKDVVKSTAKTARGIRHILNGNSKYASLAASMAVGGAMYAHKAGIDKAILKAGKTLVKNIKGSNIQAGMSASDFLKNLK